jgi:DNA invertase Pin-like site-specific DNA recombinase
MKRAALYMRVSTLDQHPENQLNELRQFAGQRGFEIVEEYTDHGIRGAKARLPALDRMLNANRRRFDVVVVWACDRLARSTKHFLQVLDELNYLGIQFLSQRESIDTDGPLGRTIVVIISAIAELERSLIVERVRAGMRRAKLEGRRIGRTPLDVDRAASVPKLKGTLIGPSHNDIQGQPDCRLASFPCVNGVYGYLGYPAAWMMDRLQSDIYAQGAFVNATGEIFSETKNWEYVASNIQ